MTVDVNEKIPVVWSSGGIHNGKLFEKLCQRWEFDQRKLTDNLHKISHAIGKPTANTYKISTSIAC